MVSNFFWLKIEPFMRLYETLWRGRKCHRRQCGKCALYSYKQTLRIRNNYCFSTLPGLDVGAAMLSFTHTVFIVCYSNRMTGKYVKYLFMSSESRGFLSSFDLCFKPLYCHPYIVTYFTLLPADTM